jgi:probable addiction module antidote protein
MTRIKTRRWDPAVYLRDEADMAAYLSAALEEEDPTLLAAIRDDIARAKRMREDTRA